MCWQTEKSICIQCQSGKVGLTVLLPHSFVLSVVFCSWNGFSLSIDFMLRLFYNATDFEEEEERGAIMMTLLLEIASH